MSVAMDMILLIWLIIIAEDLAVCGGDHGYDPIDLTDLYCRGSGCLWWGSWAWPWMWSYWSDWSLLQRIWLSVVGIMSVAMGMILAYGLCSLFGLFYSAAHTVIPFLLLGIGIDNIFVITQVYKMFYLFNPFLFIKNKWLFISSEGFSALEKNTVMCSLRAMLPSSRVWQSSADSNDSLPHIFWIWTSWVGSDSPLLTIMAVWRASNVLKKCVKRPLLSAEDCHTRPDHSAEYCSLQRAGGPWSQ